jgi:hypothetical protein
MERYTTRGSLPRLVHKKAALWLTFVFSTAVSTHLGRAADWDLRDRPSYSRQAWAGQVALGVWGLDLGVECPVGRQCSLASEAVAVVVAAALVACHHYRLGVRLRLLPLDPPPSQEYQ